MMIGASRLLTKATELKAKFLKYFLEGQRLINSQEIRESNQSPQWCSWEEKLMTKYRKYMALAIPFALAQIVWWSLAIRHDFFTLFPDRYYMSITMVFGALVAGATSEGGGAVAFPVMTLVFSIAPDIARDFTLLIQSCGMTAASFTILFMNIQLEWHSIIYCTAGGLVGLVLGFELVVDTMTPPMKKMFFVSLSSAFAVALLLLNRQKKRKTFDWIQNICAWKIGVLFSVGILGGLFSAFSGSGVDLYSFAALTLLFHVSEKVATPTSVVIMAFISIAGAFYRTALQYDNFPAEAWNYLAVCVPIVTIFAPIGSFISSHFHRQVLACLIYILELAGLVGAFAIVRPGLQLSLISVGILAVGALSFYGLSRLGNRLHQEELKHTMQVADSGNEVAIEKV